VPTTEELRGAVFAPGTTFRVKEKVAVPRSRGGFTLGYIAKPVPRRHCYVDPTTPISANHQEWRVRASATLLGCVKLCVCVGGVCARV
jgi:hypothetical protein